MYKVQWTRLLVATSDLTLLYYNYVTAEALKEPNYPDTDDVFLSREKQQKYINTYMNRTHHGYATTNMYKIN